MKTRNGFISNSSSSSFIIRIDSLIDGYKWDSREAVDKKVELFKSNNLIPEDSQTIYDFTDAEKAIQELIEYNDTVDDPWWIESYKGYLLFHTNLDNFDMKEYLETKFGKRKIHFALEIYPHQGYREEIGIGGLKEIIDHVFHECERWEIE